MKTAKYTFLTLIAGLTALIFFASPSPASAQCTSGWECATNVCGDTGDQCGGSQRNDPQYCWWKDCAPPPAPPTPTNTPAPTPIPTPIPGETTASISGPGTGTVAVKINFSAFAQTRNDTLNKGQILVAKTDKSDSSSWCINSGGVVTAENWWCRLTENTLGGTSQTFPAGWIPQGAGSYYATVNAFSASGKKCSGNPWCRSAQGTCPADASGSSCQNCTGFADCGSSDYLTTTIYNPPCAVTNATCGISTSDSITINNLSYRNTTSASGLGIWRATTNQDSTNIVQDSTYPSSYTDSYLLPNITYYYALACYLPVGGGTGYVGYFPPNGQWLACKTPPAPTIDSLKINNSLTPSMTGTYGASGKVSNESGSNWLNPMTITAKATAPTGANITQYFVAFYDRTSIATPWSTVVSGVNNTPLIKNLLSSNYNAGFVLRYDSNGEHYVWDPFSKSGAGDWEPINEFTLGGYSICGKNSLGNKDCANNKLYTVFPISSSPSWEVRFLGIFGSKNLFTAVQVYDNNGSTVTNPDIAPRQ